MEHSPLKRYRENAHLSIQELARLAHVDETNIIRAETGKAVPGEKADAIAAALSNVLHVQLTPGELEIRTE